MENSFDEKLIAGIPRKHHITRWRERLGGMFNAPVHNVDHIKHKWLDLPYTNEPSGKTLDIYQPEEGTGPFPVILYIHGGGWILGHKRVSYIEPLFYLLQKGYALVSIDYSLSTEAEFPTQIFEVKTAIRWIRENADKYNLQADKIIAWGDSAGGHLAALTGTSNGVAQLEDQSFGSPGHSSDVAAVVDWFGPTNFFTFDEQLTKVRSVAVTDNDLLSLELLFLGDLLQNIPEKVKAACPGTHLNEKCPPFVVQHGNNDIVVSVEQSIDFVKDLKKVIPESKILYEILEGAVHEDERFYAKENIDKIIAFLEKVIV